MKITTTYHQLRAASEAEPTRTVVGILYRAADHGRGGHSAAWQVYAFKAGRDMNTDPNAAWYNNKLKTFLVWGASDRKTVLAQALEWVHEEYGLEPTEFVANRFREMIPAWVKVRFPLVKEAL